jgi:hypothetical protein
LGSGHLAEIREKGSSQAVPVSEKDGHRQRKEDRKEEFIFQAHDPHGESSELEVNKFGDAVFIDQHDQGYRPNSNPAKRARIIA